MLRSIGLSICSIVRAIQLDAASEPMAENGEKLVLRKPASLRGLVSSTETPAADTFGGGDGVEVL